MTLVALVFAALYILLFVLTGITFGWKIAGIVVILAYILQPPLSTTYQLLN